ncbi:hypothetical protein PPSIR1_00115 [Plesiocystis pacifica SIR-1]|uniref:Cupin type-2 domain-containing protein n=1 Tax=Plesiocystis pacifica SIR-1 TaxID=391625 RepID=A6GET8_9BACT|nr:cupin domain-containing protein [Plesiocystis pacifica]EDM75600.1 hypothetical protein PPSIR1_00115 [Plesiocystis pacifica SIR-1]
MRSSFLTSMGMFVLGACATVAVQSSAATTTSEAGEQAGEAAPTAAAPVEASLAGVRALGDAPQAVAPNGKATVTHLAMGDNAYLGLLRMDGGGAVPVHRDETEEYIHVLEGGGVITIDGQQHEVGGGATIYMPAGAEVSYQNGDAEMVAIQVFAGPGPSAKYSKWAAPSE